MGQLLNNLNAAEKAKIREYAGQSIKTITALKIQYDETKADVITLKARIKADVVNDIWNKTDIKALATKSDLLEGIKTKGQRYKADLVGMKAELDDEIDKTEIQTEIDNLNLNGE